MKYFIFIAAFIGLLCSCFASQTDGSGKRVKHSHKNLKPNEKCKECLVFGLHPYMPAQELMHRYTPLLKYLEKKLGKPISVSIAKNWQDHIDRAGRGELDIFYLGAVSYISLTEQYGQKKTIACIATNGASFLRGYIIVRKDSPAKSLSDLKDKTFGVSSLDSTMGYVYPRYMFISAGIPFPHDKLKVLGSDINVALAVIAGMIDAGAVRESVWNKYKDRNDLRILAETPLIMEHVFAASDNLDEATVKKIQKEMRAISEDKELVKKLLKPIKKSITGLNPVKPSDFEELRKIIKKVRDDEEKRGKPKKQEKQ